MRTDTLNKSDYRDNGIKITDVDSAGRLSTPKMADENVMPFPLSLPIKSYLYKDQLYIYAPLIVNGFISKLKQNKISTSFYDGDNTMHQPRLSRKMLISTESKCTITTVNFKPNQLIYGSIYIKTKPQLAESPYFKSGFIKQCLTFKYYFKIKPVMVYKKPGLQSFI